MAISILNLVQDLFLAVVYIIGIVVFVIVNSFQDQYSEFIPEPNYLYFLNSSFFLSFCLSIFLSINPSISPSLNPSIFLSLYLFVFPQKERKLPLPTETNAGSLHLTKPNLYFVILAFVIPNSFRDLSLRGTRQSNCRSLFVILKNEGSPSRIHFGISILNSVQDLHLLLKSLPLHFSYIITHSRCSNRERITDNRQQKTVQIAKRIKKKAVLRMKGEF